jgi:hypothetical protein
MFSRLLALVGILLLTQQSLPQQSQSPTNEVPETCPITKSSDNPFIPPWPYPTVPYPGGSWYGSDGLWTVAPETWKGLGHLTPTDPSFRQKMQWWRQGYDYHTEPKPKLKVTGKRLDAPAPPLVADANNVAGRLPSMMVGMNFPTLGCWEVTGRYGDDELTFVVWLSK